MYICYFYLMFCRLSLTKFPLLLSVLMLLGLYANSQTTVFNYTGSFQTYVVPAPFDCIDVVVEGAQGGGTNGGLGARVTATIPVTPGQTLRVYVGERCSGTGTSFNGGGAGQTATSAGDPSFCGGGGSDIRVAPYGTANRIVVAGGGGGQGGGTEDGQGGDGGCATGGIGAAPFGVGGSGGTQAAGGAGGPAWNASGNSGFDGSFFSGGNGAVDPCNNNSPGGGGGGGYYGGGGGGSDCWNIAPYGGGGGGGGSSLTPAGGACTAGARSGHGRVSITPISCSLPIELLSFTGENIGEYNKLNWITTTEINNDYFVLESSKDGYYFSFVGEVNGAGNSTQQIDYELIDKKPLADLTYYRLKQVDFDGKYSYSNIVALKRKPSPDLNVFPNPTNGDFTLYFNQTINGELRIYNGLGQVVYDQHLENKDNIKLNVDIPIGVYYLNVNTVSGEVITKRIIKE